MMNSLRTLYQSEVFLIWSLADLMIYNHRMLMVLHPKQKTFAKASIISPWTGICSCRTGVFFEADFPF
jgi:hypothetical protein